MVEIIPKRFGLLGRNISYSFSKGYFTEKFNNDESLQGCLYENFDIPEINVFPEIIKAGKHLIGLNVTIPYKVEVMEYLDDLSEIAKEIGAVNTVKIEKNGKLKGYNTDYYGFMKSLEPLLLSHHKKALILGTGGASKAIGYALNQLKIDFSFVSRQQSSNVIGYDQLDEITFKDYQIIINSTPLGTSPNVDFFPNIPYEFFDEKHIAYDLIYNPAETQFLKKASARGATIKNGQDMLIYQAEKAWEIWNS